MKSASSSIKKRISGTVGLLTFIKTMDQIQCPDCPLTFTEKHNMLRHLEKQHAQLVCHHCDRIFFGAAVFNKHVKNAHENPGKLQCSKCDKRFGRSDNCHRHEKLCGVKVPVTTRKRPGVEPLASSNVFHKFKLRSAFNGTAQSWRITLNRSSIDVISTLKDAILSMEDTLNQFRYERIALKFTMALHAVFVKANDPFITTDPSICLVSQPFEVYMDTRIEDQLMNAYKQLLNEIAVFEGNGSG